MMRALSKSRKHPKRLFHDRANSVHSTYTANIWKYRELKLNIYPSVRGY